MLTVAVGDERLELLPQKAAFHPRTRTLLIADAHFGKAVSFRKLGVPVPRGTTSANLALLTALVAQRQARRIVFLGDFLHSERSHAATTLGALARWRAEHAALELVLVRGNHDERAGDPPATLGFEIVDEPLVGGGLVFCHHPAPHAAGYVIAGHLHPCVSLGGRAHEHLRLPCFHFGASVGVLPAFGDFTGTVPVRPEPGDRLYAIADAEVVELPT